MMSLRGLGNHTVEISWSSSFLNVSVSSPHCQATWPLFKLNRSYFSSVLSPFPPYILLFGGQEYFKTNLLQVWHHFDSSTLVCISRGQELCLCVHSYACSHTLLKGNPAQNKLAAPAQGQSQMSLKFGLEGFIGRRERWQERREI